MSIFGDCQCIVDFWFSALYKHTYSVTYLLSRNKQSKRKLIITQRWSLHARVAIAVGLPRWYSRQSNIRGMKRGVLPTRRSASAICYDATSACLSVISRYTWSEVTSQSPWSRYDRHCVGITRHNALSEMAKIYRVIQAKLNQSV